ncbi:MAG: dockerin type I domain-containing protein [Alistipes sp.]|nr:dockerin type I domain-containing protein [Alistipes sp.]
MKGYLKKPLSIILSALLLSQPVFWDFPDNQSKREYTVNAVDIDEVDIVLDNVLYQMANTVTEPSFGTNFGEWSVLCLARGKYYSKDDKYFSDYYERIVETVNKTVASVNKDGALHKAKSTENSRLILALSAIGKDAESVGDWNLITPYNDFNWIKKQGINGPIFTIIALDTLDYQTSDPTVRQQCIDFILEKQLDDGGWALTGSIADPDITAMTLQALAGYVDEPQIADSIEKGIDCLSRLQRENGGYASWGTINSESIAQVITACTALGIDPDTDERFVKNGRSAVDAILEFYDPDSMTFSHIIGDGGNAMATDQAAYALIAYRRFVNGENSLYDMNDVWDDEQDDDNNDVPDDVIDDNNGNGDDNSDTKPAPDDINVPDSDDKNDTEPEIKDDTNCDDEPEAEAPPSYNEEQLTENKPKTTTVNSPAVTVKSTVSVRTSTTAAVTTAKTTATKAVQTTEPKPEFSFRAISLYEGGDIDVIPASKRAAAIAVDGTAAGAELSFGSGTKNTYFYYNEAISEKIGTSVYFALVDSDVDMNAFADSENYTIGSPAPEKHLVFGDINGDGIINAQDALMILDSWQGKITLTDEQILRSDLNGDGRINTLDAIEISDFFVNGTDFSIAELIALSLEEK